MSPTARGHAVRSPTSVRFRGISVRGYISLRSIVRLVISFFLLLSWGGVDEPTCITPLSTPNLATIHPYSPSTPIILPVLGGLLAESYAVDVCYASHPLPNLFRTYKSTRSLIPPNGYRSLRPGGK